MLLLRSVALLFLLSLVKGPTLWACSGELDQRLSRLENGIAEIARKVTPSKTKRVNSPLLEQVEYYKNSEVLSYRASGERLSGLLRIRNFLAGEIRKENFTVDALTDYFAAHPDLFWLDYLSDLGDVEFASIMRLFLESPDQVSLNVEIQLSSYRRRYSLEALRSGTTPRTAALLQHVHTPLQPPRDSIFRGKLGIGLRTDLEKIYVDVQSFRPLMEGLENLLHALRQNTIQIPATVLSREIEKFLDEINTKISKAAPLVQKAESFSDFFVRSHKDTRPNAQMEIKDGQKWFTDDSEVIRVPISCNEKDKNFSADLQLIKRASDLNAALKNVLHSYRHLNAALKLLSEASALGQRETLASLLQSTRRATEGLLVSANAR